MIALLSPSRRHLRWPSTRKLLANGIQLPLGENGQFNVKSWGMTYRIISEQDRINGYDRSWCANPGASPARRLGYRPMRDRSAYPENPGATTNSLPAAIMDNAVSDCVRGGLTAS